MQNCIFGRSQLILQQAEMHLVSQFIEHFVIGMQMLQGYHGQEMQAIIPQQCGVKQEESVAAMWDH